MIIKLVWVQVVTSLALLRITDCKIAFLTHSWDELVREVDGIGDVDVYSFVG